MKALILATALAATTICAFSAERVATEANKPPQNSTHIVQPKLKIKNMRGLWLLPVVLIMAVVEGYLKANEVTDGVVIGRLWPTIAQLVTMWMIYITVDSWSQIGWLRFIVISLITYFIVFTIPSLIFKAKFAD